MRIQFVGQCCFYLTGDDGRRVLMDPFHRSCGLTRGEFPADLVTFSHRHLDHYDAEAPRGALVVEGPGEHEAAGLRIKGLQAFHDQQEGLLRGQVTIFRLEMDGFAVVHLSDLGHSLNRYARKELSPVDVLLFPAGGRVTLDPDEARSVVEFLQPRIAIPMAYHTPGLLIGTLNRDRVQRAYPVHTASRVLELPRGTKLPNRTEIRFLDVLAQGPAEHVPLPLPGLAR